MFRAHTDPHTDTHTHIHAQPHMRTTNKQIYWRVRFLVYVMFVGLTMV